MTTPPLNLEAPDADFSYETSPHLYLFTSLTAGSSHIITATSRLETILKANRIPFKAVDCATDEKARRIWSRRAGKRKLPGLVKEGMVVGDLVEVEEWNEYGEIKEHLGGGSTSISAAAPAQEPAPLPPAPRSTTAPAQETSKSTDEGNIDALDLESSEETTKYHQQSLLAQEAAAAGAARNKSGKQFSSSKRDAVSGRSPERDADYSLDKPMHNTSSSTALPPLHVQTKETHRVPVDLGDTPETASGQSPSIPHAPPPTAIEPSSHGINLASLEAATAAGPASKSGLDAVTDRPSSEFSPPRRGNITFATDEEIKQIEKTNSIPEEPDEDGIEIDGDPDADITPLPLEGNSGRHIKFEEDSLKGDPTDGAAAEKSVED